MKRPPEIAAVYRRAPAANKCPPDAPTSEGASIAVGANAEAPYLPSGSAGKVFGPRKIGEDTRRERNRDRARLVTYRSLSGRVWTFSGKRGRVLAMLATMPDGVTPWDCLPWHTRLGASVHALRSEGIAIDTEREGEYRHARYRLTTPGRLMIQAKNSRNRECQE